MNTINQKVNFGDLKFIVPTQSFSTIAEATQALGEANVLARLNKAVAPKVAAIGTVVRTVQALTKVAFKQKTSKGKDGKTVSKRDTKADSNTLYVQRALKAVPAVTLEAVNAELAKNVLAIGPRTKKSPKLGKLHIAKATEYIEGRKPFAQANAVLAKFGLPAFAPNGDKAKDIETLGRLFEQVAQLHAQQIAL